MIKPLAVFVFLLMYLVVQRKRDHQKFSNLRIHNNTIDVQSYYNFEYLDSVDVVTGKQHVKELITNKEKVLSVLDPFKGNYTFRMVGGFLRDGVNKYSNHYFRC